MTASEEDPRVERFRQLLDATDDWRAKLGGDAPGDTAAHLAGQIIAFMRSTGLHQPFDYRVVGAMWGEDGEPPPDQDERAAVLGQDPARILRGAARLLDDFSLLAPVAMPPRVRGWLLQDAYRVAEGEQPLLAQKIPRASHKQDNPVLWKAIVGHTIRRAIYQAAKDGAPGGWIAVHRNLFPGAFSKTTLDTYKDYVPGRERELTRAAGRARREGLQLTPAQEAAEAEALRHSLENLRKGLAAPRANEWK